MAFIHSLPPFSSFARTKIIALTLLLLGCGAEGASYTEQDAADTADGTDSSDSADRADTPDREEGMDAIDGDGTLDPEREETPADIPAEDSPGDDPAQDVPADASCEQNVPVEVDALQGNGQYLPGMNENLFCARGSVTYTITDIPSSEIEAIDAGATEYRIIFALADTGNRNYARSSIQLRTDTPGSEMIVKTGGGTCINCMCCPCRLGTIHDGWCASEIYRPNCPIFEEGSQYTISWDSDSHTMCFRRGANPERCFVKDIDQLFAFNRYCGGAGCSMMHWGAGSWSGGTVTFNDFQCEQTVTAAPESCP